MTVAFEGYIDAQRGKDGMFYIKRLTDFGAPSCDRQAFDLATRLPFKGQAIQGFVCTPHEAPILHGGR